MRQPTPRVMVSVIADHIELVLRPKPDVKPLDLESAQRLARVAGAETVALDGGAAVFRFAGEADAGVVRGNLELAARFELGAHWQTRYEVEHR